MVLNGRAKQWRTLALDLEPREPGTVATPWIKRRGVSLPRARGSWSPHPSNVIFHRQQLAVVGAGQSDGTILEMRRHSCCPFSYRNGLSSQLPLGPRHLLVYGPALGKGRWDREKRAQLTPNGARHLAPRNSTRGGLPHHGGFASEWAPAGFGRTVPSRTYPTAGMKGLPHNHILGSCKEVLREQAVRCIDGDCTEGTVDRLSALGQTGGRARRARWKW